MSKISTKKGDAGFSDLLGGGRVKKSHPLYAALGDIDELNALLGVVRVLAQGQLKAETDANLEWIQKELIQGMGDVASLLNPKLEQCTWRFTETSLERLEHWGLAKEEMALKSATLRGWALPGATGSMISVQLDVARTVCRRAERSVFVLLEEFPAMALIQNWSFPKFLNRLSDVLWIEARGFESESSR